MENTGSGHHPSRSLVPHSGDRVSSSQSDRWRPFAQELYRRIDQGATGLRAGSAYEYGFGITIAGRIAEIASGEPFDELVRKRILEPLRMHDTSFHPDERMRQRIARSYKTDEDSGRLVRANNSFVTVEAAERRVTEPSGGLFSTAADMSKFYSMILNGGVVDGKRIVSEASIAEMTRPHHAGGKAIHYGLGWQCGPGDKPAIPGFSSKSFGHGGAYATHGWIDPEQKMIAVFMVQNVLVKNGNAARQAFHSKVTGVTPESGR